MEKYLDIPFQHMGRHASGCDCIGLARLWYEQERGYAIVLPEEMGLEYSDQYEDAPDGGLARLLMMWGSRRKAPHPGDIVVFGNGQPTHIGIYQGNGAFLNQQRSVGKSILDHMNNDWFLYYMGAIRMDDKWAM